MSRPESAQVATALERGHGQAIINTAADAIISKDRNAVITSWNRSAERLYGYSAEEAVGQSIAMLIPEHRSGEETEILSRILAGEVVEHYETERMRKDGEILTVSLRISPIYTDDGTIAGASVIARDITEQRAAQDRSESLQRITAALAEAISTDRAGEIVLDEAVSTLGAEAATIGMVDRPGENINILASRGYSEKNMAAWQSFPVDGQLPMSDVVRTREPVWLSTKLELAGNYPAVAGGALPYGALAVTPLVVEGQAFGAIALSFHDEREFEPPERAFLLAASQQAANALFRARLHDSERSARDQLAFVVRASEVLAETLDLDETFDRLGSIAVPRVADWFSVDLVLEGETRNVAVAHFDPEKVELAKRIRERYPPDPDSETGVPQVIRTGEPEMYPEIPQELLEQGAVDEEHLGLIRELGLVSAMVVPLKARGEVLGALTLVSAESGRHYGEEDLELAQELAGHAALAVENALLYQREHEAALTLQRALLPEQLPELEGLKFAGRYQPGGHGLEAGGDWYDAIPCDDGTVVLVIGDVSGRGIPAASIMGRIRTAIHAYVVERHTPVAAVMRLDRVVADFTQNEMATLIWVTLDPRTGEAEYVVAGHPPAFIRSPDGKVAELDAKRSPPVGVFPRPRFKLNRTTIEPGSILFMYTDGLVERRSNGIDPGLETLRKALAGAPADPDACADAAMAALDPGEAADDVAILAVRVGE